MNKKVYFAGSIRGGRVDAELYHRMVTYIQKTDTVLTERCIFYALCAFLCRRDPVFG